MRKPNEQATLEAALGWFSVGMIALILVPIPVIVLVSALRIVAGSMLLLVGLFAWVSKWVVLSV